MLDIKLKNNRLDREKLKYIITWIVIGISIISALAILILDNDNKILKLLIILLICVNTMILIKFLENQFRIIYIWKLINLSINKIENNKDLLEKSETIGNDFKKNTKSHYEKVVNNINEILLFARNGINNTVKNEKMNIELVNNLTNKLDKPLNAILDNIEILSVNEEKENEALVILSEKSNNLKILIEELFEASKIASGDLNVEMNYIEIAELLKQSLVEFKDKIDQSSLNFKVNIPKEKILIKCSGEKMWRVFDVLIKNALKHSLDNSRVYIDILNDDERVYIKIKNTSESELNINPKDLVYIMNSNKEEAASGLSIEIARNLIIIQDGEFNIGIDGDLFKVEITFNREKINNDSEESMVI